MNGWKRWAGFLGLLAIGLSASPALAQFGSSDEDLGRPGPGGKPKGWGGIAVDLSEVRLALEVTDVEALDSDGVTRIDPLSSSAANDNIDYFARHTFFGLRGFGEFRLSMGVVLGGFVRVGTVAVDLVDEIQPGSVFVGLGGDPRNETATSWGRLAFGLGVNGAYEHRKLRIGGEWEFSYGAAGFEDTRFFDDRIQGDYSYWSMRFRGKLGYDADFIIPQAFLGMLLYGGTTDLEEANDPTPRTYKASFGALDLFEVGLGAEFKASKYVYGKISVTFLAETAFELTVGLHFS